VNSSEWRTAGSLLRWCQATLVLATPAIVAGCSWDPASYATSVEMLAKVPTTRHGADLDRDVCRVYCRAYDMDGIPSLGVAPRPSPVSGCHLATFAMTPEKPLPNAVVPPVGSTVLICEYHWAGQLDVDPFGLPGAPYGRLVARAKGFRGAPRSAREHFHRAAYYEAASIVAFEQLAFDLEALGAPPELVRAAERAAEDETVHTRLSLALAQAHTGAPPPPWPRLPVAHRRNVRRLDLGLDNARGGCVNETLGTWLQLHQAAAARDPHLRAVARRIAEDEARHAALSFRIFDWLDPQLDAGERRLVRARLLDATRTLPDDDELAPAVAASIGLPDRAQVARMARMLRHTLPLVCQGR
jgi:hypothetical protein